MCYNINHITILVRYLGTAVESISFGVRLPMSRPTPAYQMCALVKLLVIITQPSPTG